MYLSGNMSVRKRTNVVVRVVHTCEQWKKSVEYKRKLDCINTLWRARHCQFWLDNSVLGYTEKKTPKDRWDKTLGPQNKNHGTRPYQSLLNPCFSLLYSHAGYAQL